MLYMKLIIAAIFINTPHRESAVHMVLRLGHLEAIKLVIESPTLDIVRCDALQKSRMLPECCVIDDVHKLPADSDSTLTKRRSFGDQFLLFVRQNATDYMENNFPPGREVIRDLIIVQDERLPPLNQLLQRVEYGTLTTLCIVDSKLRWTEHAHGNGKPEVDLFSALSLRCLVLSNTHLSRLPRGIFEMKSLEVLKIDRNYLEEVPAEIGNLTNLLTFCCDTQRPRLRSIPHSITRLERLQVLSFSNNRIDNIAWIVALPNLRVLRCDRNLIVRLPVQMVNLRDLTTLDISHNRIESIPALFVDMLARLHYFEYFNLSLRPRHVRRDRAQLLAHLEMEHFLQQQPSMHTGSADQRPARDVTVAIVGESHSGKLSLVEALRDDRGISRHDIRPPNSESFKINQFEIRNNDTSCHVSTLVMANDILDNFCRNIRVDLYLLTVDLTSLELHNGSQHLFARHVSRLQMWLQALYEVSPDTPVLLVGTHAELVRSMSFCDIWHILEGLLNQSRSHHIKRYTDCRFPFCLLCNPKALAVRQTTAKHRSSGAGFVDLSYPHCEPIMNGHAPGGADASMSTGPSAYPGKYRFPHVVGYYETDSKKHFPKDSKKSNLSIDQLRSAIIRLTTHQLTASYTGVPSVWLAFIRHLSAVKDQAPTVPCLAYDEIVSIARSFEISPHQVPLMLQYFHQRGNVVFFPNDDFLSRLVVINPAWFIQMIGRALESFDSSRCNISHVLQCLSDRDLDRHLLKAAGSSSASPTSGQWLLAALQRLDLCLPLADCCPSSDEKQLVFPNLLETGSPSQDVWPDVPEWDEKQITCDFRIRALKPNQFMDFILRINREGRRMLEIVPDPVPVFLSHHIVFFTGIDLGGCEDCCNIRRRLRSNSKQDDDFDVMDDVMHKVHIMLHSTMDTIRIQVRGVSPCCTMKAVLNFLELYLDDVPDEVANDASSTSDRTSLNSQAASAVSFSTDSRGTLISGNSHGSGPVDDDDDRHFFLLCPKCVLLRHAKPERIVYQCTSAKRKAICSRWHNLGSWTRAITGDYRCTNNDLLQQTSLTTLPDYEHPRLVLVLPPSAMVSTKEWYMFSRIKFLEGFEVHFLCENPAYWHMTDNSGFRLHQSASAARSYSKKAAASSPAGQIATILGMALPMVQVVQGVNEHSQNCRLVVPVVSDLIKMYEYLRNVDVHVHDPYTWLTKNKDRVVAMLTKVLANASDGLPDLYFKAGSSISAEMIFQSASKANRYELAKFLRIESSSGRFGPLRPLYVGREIRWVCDTHYEELRAMPSK